MLSLEALRLAAHSVPAVLVDSAQLLELLDLVEKVQAKTKVVRKKREANEDDERCARWLYTTLLGTAPKAKQPNFAAWAEEVRLMRERDGRTHREMCELFQWAHSDTFWRQNILSPTKLREHWDKLTIKREAAAQPKPAAAAVWWTSEVGKLAKAVEVGVGPARAGESAASWEGRIKAAIDNGGKPPTPQVHVRQSEAANTGEQRGMKPAGLDLLALVRRTPPESPAKAA